MRQPSAFFTVPVPRLITAWGLLFALAPPHVLAGSAEAQARDWLLKMGRAGSEVCYTGEFVYQQGDKLESMRVFHRVERGGEEERLISLSGVEKGLMRRSAAARGVSADPEFVGPVEPRIGVIPSALLDPDFALGDHYRLTVLEDEPVAGRDTRVIDVMPTDDYRFGYRLWIDRQTGILLRSELHRRSGELLEQVLFTHIEIVDGIPDEVFEPKRNAAAYTRLEEAGDAADLFEPDGESNWRTDWLPGGFTRSYRMHQPVEGSDRQMEQAVYSDGMASFSIYVEEILDQREYPQGASELGVINAFGLTKNGYHVTVVGEVPLDTVTRVARSIRLIDPH